MLSFFAGRAQTSWRSALIAGALTDVACVGGFYLSFLTLDPVELGLSASTLLPTVALTSLVRWLDFVAYWASPGSSAVPCTERWPLWRGSRLLAAGLAVAAPFIAEPGLWPLRNGYYQGPWFFWAAEIVVGLAVAWRVLMLWRQQPGHPQAL